jgi:uncharacterized protein (TIGR02246 family)
MSQLPRELHGRFRDAFNAQDLDRLVALYEPGAVLVTVDGPVQGLDAIRDAYRGFLAGSPAIELETLGVHRAGDLAMLHGRWVVHRTDSHGERVRSQGRSTETVRLQSDGRWLFVIDNPSVA